MPTLTETDVRYMEQIPELELFFDVLGAEIQQRSIIEDAITAAVTTQSLPILKQIYDTLGLRALPFQKTFEAAYRRAASAGTLDIVKWLICDTTIAIDVTAMQCYGFRSALVAGHLKTASWLVEKFPDFKKQFSVAVLFDLSKILATGNIPVIEYVLENFLLELPSQKVVPEFLKKPEESTLVAAAPEATEVTAPTVETVGLRLFLERTSLLSLLFQKGNQSWMTAVPVEFLQILLQYFEILVPVDADADTTIQFLHVALDSESVIATSLVLDACEVAHSYQLRQPYFAAEIIRQAAKAGLIDSRVSLEQLLQKSINAAQVGKATVRL